MAKRDDPVLRFALGNRYQPYTPVWRVWTHGADAYASVRVLARTFKLSLHKSGQWITAFTSESGQLVGDGSRTHKRWERPEPDAGGWTTGPAIVIPWVPWAADFERRWEYPDSTTWSPAPGVGEKVVVELGFQDRSSPVKRPHAHHLASLALESEETLEVVTHRGPMDPRDWQGLASAQKEFMGFGVQSLEGLDAWGLWVTSADQAVPVPLLVQFPMGRHHFRVEAEARE